MKNQTKPNAWPTGLGFGFVWFGAGDRTRTGTLFGARDFKSLVSTYSTTPAIVKLFYHVFPEASRRKSCGALRVGQNPCEMPGIQVSVQFSKQVSVVFSKKTIAIL